MTNIALLQPNEVQIQQHIDFLTRDFRDKGLSGLIEIAWSDPQTHQVQNAQLFPLEDWERAADFAANKNRIPETNVYVGAAIRKPNIHTARRSGKEGILGSRFLWADFDDQSALEEAKKFWRAHDLFPSYLVRTGTKPNFRAQCWWKMETTIEGAQSLDNQLGKIKRLFPNADHSVLEAAHVMRLAGTISYPKPEKIARGYQKELTELKTNKNGRELKQDELIDRTGGTEKRKVLEPSQNVGNSKLNAHSSIAEALENSRVTGRWHNSMRRATALGVFRGFTDAQITEICAPFCTDGAEDPDLKVLLDGARKKFSTNKEEIKSGQKISIIYDPENLDLVIQKSEEALLQNCDIYQRGGSLIRPEHVIISGFDGSITQLPGVRSLSVAAISELLSRVVQFWKMTINRNGEIKQIPIAPPETVAKFIHQRQDQWPFPPVSSVTTTPNIDPEGNVNERLGYDPKTTVFLLSSPEMEPIPHAPSREEAEEACTLLESLIEEFPFVDETDKSVGLSLLISSVGRGMFSVCPMHAVDAPTPGSGKSYLVDVAATLATGSPAAVITWSTQEAENEKRMDGALLDGSTLIVFDNVTGNLGGDKICQVVERPILRIRRLGGSDNFDIENRTLTLATGNNLSIKGDLSRRALIARLDAKLERPELREFRSRPTDRIKTDRGKFIRAVFIILKAHIAAGRPGKLRPLASFEAWSDCVRSAIVWLGRPDPVKSMQAVIDNDPERLHRQTILEEVYAAFGSTEMPLAQLIARVDERRGTDFGDDWRDDEGVSTYRFAELREALFEVAGRGHSIDKVTLGTWCRSNKDRPTGGFLLKSRAGRSTLWRVVKNE